MTDERGGSTKRTGGRATADGRRELLVAFIEHGSRPAATVLVGLLLVAWMFTVRNQLFEVLRDAETVKLGAVEVVLRDSAASLGLSEELHALRGLRDDQLQLFLVVGKYRDRIEYSGEEVNEENLRALEEAGLVEEWEKEADHFTWRVSKEGSRLHDLIRCAIFSSIRQSGTQ